jgi:hypothetical protein
MLAPVAEALEPHAVVFVDLRGRPVPSGGIRTALVKPADRRAVVEQPKCFLAAKTTAQNSILRLWRPTA